MDVEGNEGLELALHLLFLCLLAHWLFGELFPLDLLGRQCLVFFLSLLLLLLQLTFSLQEVELPLPLLLLRLNNRLHLHFFWLFCDEFLLLQFLEVLHLLGWFVLLGLRLQLLPKAHILLVFPEICMFQYFGDF